MQERAGRSAPMVAVDTADKFHALGGKSTTDASERPCTTVVKLTVFVQIPPRVDSFWDNPAEVCQCKGLGGVPERNTRSGFRSWFRRRPILRGPSGADASSRKALPAARTDRRSGR